MANKTLYVVLTANATAYKAALKSAGDDTRRFGDEVGDADANIRAISTDLNSMSGRLKLTYQALLTLGPAFVPIAAQGAPAVAALSSQLGFATAAAGATAVAMWGLGDAVTALNEYELAPTADNLAKVQEALGRLAPSARQFAVEIQAFGDSLLDVQHASAEGLFPHLTMSLDDLEAMVPEISGLMYELADISGGLAERTASAFNSDGAREFVDFIQSNARPTLTTLYETVADLGRGTAELWMAFNDSGAAFGEGMADAAESFADWAAGLEDSEGFEDFLDYLNDTGPQVAETLGSLAGAAVDVLVALAPMGEISLTGLEIAADLLGTIADSPIGPSLLIGVAALTVLNRTLGATAGLMNKAGLTGAGGAKISATGSSIFGGLVTTAQKATTSVRDLSSGLRTLRADTATVTGAVGTTTGAIGPMTAQVAAAQDRVNKTTGALRTMASTAGRAAPGMLAFGASASGVAEKAGLSNTAMLAMAGSMLGPWGTAIGAGVGLAMDFAQANDDVEEAITRADEAISSGTGFAEMTSEMRSAQKALDEFNDDLDKAFTEKKYDLGAGLKWTKNWVEDIFGKSDEEELSARIDKAKAKLADMKTAGKEVAAAFGVPITGNSTAQLAQLDVALQKAQPSMTALGITTDDLRRAAAAGDGSLLNMVDRMTTWQTTADSVKGRTQAVGDAIKNLGQDAIATADSAAQLSSALDALLTPAMDLEEATDNWRASLRKLRDELNATAGFGGESPAAEANRKATRDYLDTVTTRLEALAAVSTTTEKDMAQAVAASREEFIKSGLAAGFSRKEIEARANEMGLTPDLVKTVFEAAGLTESDLAARAYQQALRSIPKNLRTVVEAEGIPKTNADIDALIRKYPALEKHRAALVTLKDNASPKIDKAQESLDKLDKSTARPSAGLRDLLLGPLNRDQGKLDKLDGSSAKPDASLRDLLVGPVNRNQSKLNNLDRTHAKPSATLRDQVMPKGTDMLALMGEVDRKHAKPSATLTDNASEKANAISRALNAIPRTVTSTVTTIRKTVGKLFEDGGIQDRGVRLMADGGYSDQGRYYDRSSRIVAGGANITWGERATGWEAYISGKPSQRARNQQILAIAAGRLGMEVAQRGYADGGVYGRELAGSAATRTQVVVKTALPERMTLSVDGHQFTAYVRGHAADVAHQAASSADAVSTQHGRMVWA